MEKAKIITRAHYTPLLDRLKIELKIIFHKNVRFFHDNATAYFTVLIAMLLELKERVPAYGASV